jgi:hypothetical protein
MVLVAVVHSGVSIIIAAWFSHHQFRYRHIGIGARFAGIRRSPLAVVGAPPDKRQFNVAVLGQIMVCRQSTSVHEVIQA